MSRLASVLARDEDWLAEHLAPLKSTSSEGAADPRRVTRTRPVIWALDLLGVQNEFTLFSTLNEALIAAR